MSALDSRVDQIVKELLDTPLPKAERMKLLRERLGIEPREGAES